MSREQLSKKYGISIVENGYYNLLGKYVKLYDIYSADGCRWETGMRNIKSVKKECEEWAYELLSIKRYVSAREGKA